MLKLLILLQQIFYRNRRTPSYYWTKLSSCWRQWWWLSVWLISKRDHRDQAYFKLRVWMRVSKSKLTLPSSLCPPTQRRNIALITWLILCIETEKEIVLFLLLSILLSSLITLAKELVKNCHWEPIINGKFAEFKYSYQTL